VNLVVWGKRAEICYEYLKKGSLIFVEGRLNYRQWETSDKEKRSTLEVNVENFQFLDKSLPEIKGEMVNGTKNEGFKEETDTQEKETGEGL